MKKKISHIVKQMPDIIKESVGLFIKNLNDNTQEIVGNTSGTIGILLRLFGKPAIDKYYEKKSIEKLKNYGIETYLEAARTQVDRSLQSANILIELQTTATEIIQMYQEVLNERKYDLKPENILVVFEPKYHPAVDYIKESQISLLNKLKVSNSQIEAFKKDFNLNILKTVEECFGTDYENHLREIEDFIHDEAEIKLLVTTFKIAKIGFDQSENLRYEETYAQWQPVSDLRNGNSTLDNELQEDDYENKLVLASELIEEYFSNNDKDSIEKLLFIIADFGKGKSVFMKQYASKYARSYINTGEGFFPIYFNLREYGQYKSEEKLGVINSYLKTRYGFDISDFKNKHKKYIFLIDSLDESGELTHSAINNVIESIKKIQRLDEIHCRQNRIIITSRPIDNVLSTHLESCYPHCIKEIPHFISLYGFKKEQFNIWLSYTLKEEGRKLQPNDVPLIQDILNQIYSEKNVDIASILTKDNVLSLSELHRPIFAYMIYRLIIKNIDFLKIGKIGIYLSFINLLSKEAKYMNDKTVNIDLKNEFKFRNILHATAALWQIERHKGNQGFLKKADICRVLEKENKGDKDSDVLARFNDITDIHFLSHSYFGENDNILHFQHQSFAEILLAEYYLKVFICYALAIENKQIECRAKLLLGNPTIQTKYFIRDLIQLLKDTVSQKNTVEVLEKRRLLFPLFASLSTKENNTLFSNDLYFEWFNKGKFENNISEYPQELLEKWCIEQEQIDKILQFSAEIVNSSDVFILAKSEPKINLFDTELSLIRDKKFEDLPNLFDKWIALMAGNILYNNTKNVKEPKLFNSDYKVDYKKNFEILRSYDFPFDLYKGIDMRNNTIVDRIFYNEDIIDQIDFSYSYLKNIHFDTFVFDTNFQYAILEDVYFKCLIFSANCFNFAKLRNVEIEEAHGELGNIGKFTNVRIKNYSNVCFYNIEYLMKEGTIKFLKKLGLIYIPQSLYIKQDKYSEPMSELNDIVVFIRTLGDYYKKEEKFYSTDLKSVLLFQDKKVEHIFYRAITENISVKEILKNEKIKYKWGRLFTD